jgi:diacylglycerol kinase family enzyme
MLTSKPTADARTHARTHARRDMNTGQLMRTWREHTEAITRVAIRDGGRTLVSAAVDGLFSLPFDTTHTTHAAHATRRTTHATRRTALTPFRSVCARAGAAQGT